MSDEKPDRVVELLGRLGEGTITGITGILGKVVEAIGRVAEGIATNADPITQGVALILAIVTIRFFLTTEPYKSALHKLGLDALLHSWENYLLTLPLDIVKTISKDLGRNDATGIFGVAVVDANTMDYIQSEFRWYDNAVSRDAAYVLIGLAVSVQLNTVVKVTRTVTVQSDGSIITGTPLPLSPAAQKRADSFKGKWAVVWDGGPGIGITVVGYWPDLSTALVQADGYNRAFNRTAWVQQIGTDGNPEGTIYRP